MKTYKKDEVIFKQGELARSMFDITAGSVGIFLAYGTENENRLAVLKAGDFLGEMGMIDYAPRSATAVALEDGTVLEEIGEKEFSSYFENRPERLLQIMRQLSSRLREQTKDYESACRILDSMNDTKNDPGKRSKSFLGEVKALLDAYDSAMQLASQYTDSSYYYPFF